MSTIISHAAIQCIRTLYRSSLDLRNGNGNRDVEYVISISPIMQLEI